MANRLASQSSPYLLQHAHNPVDWWPWGPEAIEHARRTDRPIFLSIGYSTCYWCHVMERESFTHAPTAEFINTHFVPVKLDREERPDVDELYMAATVIMTGHGGWPMSVFIDPGSLRPFYCGTYFPLEARPGMPAFGAILSAMSQAWRTQRDGVVAQAAQVAEAVAEHLGGDAEPQRLSQSHVADAVGALLRMFDRAQGGFGPAPKFPQPAFMEFLLDVRTRAGDDATGDAIDLAVRTTLDRIALGGLHDHLAGGFHRYCVDAAWSVPHFEKMLYDQAQLLTVFADAARLHADAWYRGVALRTAAFLRDEMTNDQGGLISAIDAEVDGREGASYVWSREEVRAAAGDEDAEFALRALGLDGSANFRDPHHPDDPPAHVLKQMGRPDHAAAALRMAPAAYEERLAKVAGALRRARDRRPQPRVDDKVIAAWNGLAIAGLSRAAAALDEPALLGQAARAADFIARHLMTDGDPATLRRSWRAGVAGPPGVLEDFAAVALGLTELALASDGQARSARTAQTAVVLAAAKERFMDPGGRVFDTPAHAPDLFLRGVSTHDGAVPSGASMLMHAMLNLSDLSGDPSHARDALNVLAAVSGRVAAAPAGSVGSVRALFRLLLRAEVEPGSLATPAEGGADRAAGSEPTQHLVVLAETDRVAVPTGAPVSLMIAVDIEDGWHVPAADPGDSAAAGALSPLRVSVAGGAGVVVYADYPPGEMLGEGDLAVRVYRGRVPIRLVLERAGEWKGRPMLVVSYQACSDRACLTPSVLELDIALDPAR